MNKQHLLINRPLKLTSSPLFWTSCLIQTCKCCRVCFIYILHTILVPGVSNFLDFFKHLNCWILLINMLLHLSCFKDWNMLMTCTPRTNEAFLLRGMKSFHVRISTETTVSSVLTNQAENIIREHNPGQRFPGLHSHNHPVTFYIP